MSDPRAPAPRCRTLSVMRAGSPPRLGLLLATLTLALSACAPAPAAAPVIELVVPTPPPAPTIEAKVAEVEEPPREPPKARIAGDLRPMIIRIVHTERRQADAEQVQKRLTNLGATVHLYPTSEEGNESHVGHLYINGSMLKYGPLIMRVVEDIEPQEVHQEDTLEGDHNAVVWVVR